MSYSLYYGTPETGGATPKIMAFGTPIPGSKCMNFGSGYHVRDDFSDTKGTAEINGSPCTPGPGTRVLTAIEGGGVSIGTGVLTLNNPWEEWGEALWLDAIERAAGLILLCTFNVSNNTSYGMIGFDKNQATMTDVASIFYIHATGFLVTADMAATPYVGSTQYKLAIVARPNGYFFFIKGGIFTNWSLLWKSGAGNDATLYPLLNRYSGLSTHDFIRVLTYRWLPILFSDGFGGTWPTTDGLGHAEGVAGGVGAGGGDKVWTGATWAAAGGKAYNTPALGSELTPAFVNHFQPALAYEILTLSAGDNVIDQAVNSANYGMAYSILAPVTGAWHRLAFDLTLNSGVLPDIMIAADSDGNPGPGSQFDIPYLFTANGNNEFTFVSTGLTYLFIENRNTNGDFSIGAISLKPVTVPSLFATLSHVTGNIYAAVDVTRPIGLQGGFVLALDSKTSPANFLLVYLDSGYQGAGNLKIDQWLAGERSNLLSAAITYGAGQKLEVRKVGTSIYVFYNKVKIGTATCDVGITGTLTGLIGSGPGVLFDNYVAYPEPDIGYNPYALLDNF